LTPAITLEELLVWNQESSDFWNTRLQANPELLDLSCSIGGTASVQEFVRHIWGAELRWAQRLAVLPVTDTKDMPAGPLDALFNLHLLAVGIFSECLADTSKSWDDTLTFNFPFLPSDAQTLSRRKLLGHALFHSQRHWAQLGTLVREAGFPSGFKGDLIFSSALK
jgi:uncharacterized damage-inducible protein DinB